MTRKHLRRAVTAGATIALAAAAVAAAAPAGPSATAKKKPAPRLPNGFVGQVNFDYTMDSNGDRRRSTATAKVTFRRDTSRVRGGKKSTSYVLKAGTLTWEASGDEADSGCTWAGAGSRSTVKNEVFLQLVVRRRSKATFSSPADLHIPATMTCPDRTYQSEQVILHPFFALFRKTAGVAINAKLRTIVGSSSSSAGGETWTSRWSFKATG